MKKICALLVIIVWLGACSHANALNIGRYRIGMKNAEAAKIGLDRCVGNEKRARCVPTGISEVEGKQAISSVSFENKRIQELSISFHVDRVSSERLEFYDFTKMLSELDTANCDGISHTVIKEPLRRAKTKTWTIYCIFPGNFYREVKLDANEHGGGWIEILIKKDNHKIDYIKHLAKQRKERVDLNKSLHDLQMGK
jgi:hypothetical protein